MDPNLTKSWMEIGCASNVRMSTSPKGKNATSVKAKDLRMSFISIRKAIELNISMEIGIARNAISLILLIETHAKIAGNINHELLYLSIQSILVIVHSY
jgi:hypothetical protein